MSTPSLRPLAPDPIAGAVHAPGERTPMNRCPSAFVAAVVSLLGFCAACGSAEVVRLWPKPPTTQPAARAERSERVQRRSGGDITKVSHVSDPTLTVFLPANQAGPTPAVVICPGGGYSILAWDLEGTEVAEWLNSLGIAGVVLKYRVPRQRDAALTDAQRAVSLVRHRAKAWKIDPERIGILGFSAGGHLAARAATNHAKRSYKSVDDADHASCRPDFAVLIYPAYLSGMGGKALDTNTLPVDPTTPKTFLAVAFNDKFSRGAMQYCMAMRRVRARSELHVYYGGGHGCGLRRSSASVTTWPVDCARWFREAGILPGQTARTSK